MPLSPAMQLSRRQQEGTQAHYRPDGRRRRTAGKLAARVASAEARAEANQTALSGELKASAQTVASKRPQSSTCSESFLCGLTQHNPAEGRPRKEPWRVRVQSDRQDDTNNMPTRLEGILLDIVDHLAAMSSMGASVDLPAFQCEGHLCSEFHQTATHGVPPVGR